MQTTTRKTIIDTFKQDLQDHLNVQSGYENNIAEVRSGIYLYEDFSIKPAISIWAYKDVVEEYMMGKNKIRNLLIYIYCFAPTDGITDTNNIYSLVEDIENFLESEHFTYNPDVIIGDSTIYPGGTQDQAGIGMMEITINYNQV